jgi:hypothetical protein
MIISKHLFLLKIVQQLMIIRYFHFFFKLVKTFFSEEAEACFRRIDSNIRYTLKSMLKRKHIPFVNIQNTLIYI